MKLVSKHLLFWIVIVLNGTTTQAMRVPQAIQSPRQLSLAGGLATIGTSYSNPTLNILIEENKQNIPKISEADYEKFFKDVKAGNVSAVREFIKLGADLNKADNDGNTPLIEAAFGGHEEIVQLLINDTKADVNQADKNGSTPLHWAAFKNHKEIVQLLIRANANVDQEDKNGRTPLNKVAFDGHKEVVQLLIQANADVNEVNKLGNTSLYRAAYYGHSEIAELLVERNAIIDQGTIDIARNRGHVQIASSLEKKINDIYVLCR